ncbi:hypothetical protein PDESU_05847 [Pontiella desulfatans]|uniref:HTH arsR-type domain-containing protein n=1 Tax=Pontiella desulfatans TaxID=2750659 RepID=A0A6C2UCU8_PONDE|nr:metalloregulator ArsR/SmtB family transcription factor [Pontiella desulfatans]VGO17251.1 hypothetical protein PDESU_05847 [Pontiella desulfatans]
MAELHPTLWRTCRVIASETRLRLLWLLFRFGEVSVGELAALVSLSQPNASIQLRALQSRGLICSCRDGRFVRYFAEANLAVEHASDLLEGLRCCHADGISFAAIIKDSTAFTHSRRIDIVRALALENGGMPFARLSVVAQVPPASLLRHLNKLVDRRCAKIRGETVLPGEPKSDFGRLLLHIACDGVSL